MCTSPLIWSSADVIAWAEEEGIAAAAVTALCDKNCDGATLLGVKECEIQKWGLSKSEIKHSNQNITLFTHKRNMEFKSKSVDNGSKKRKMIIIIQKNQERTLCIQ